MAKLNDDTPKKVAIYLRVSTEDQKDKYGLELQEQVIRNLVLSKKAPNGQDLFILDDRYIFKDDISGTTPWNERPELSRLFEELAPYSKDDPAKPFDVVAVYKIDRFARRLKVLLNIIDELDEKGILFLSANESIDTSTPFGKAILGIIGVIAELEIETTKQRTQDGRQEAIKQGVWMGGSPPFGYIKNPDKKLDVLEPEAKIVKQIFDMFANQNYTPQQIADYLTTNQVFSPEVSSVHFKKKAWH